MHVLTIDFECWAQVVTGEASGQPRAVGRGALERATDQLLQSLDKHRARAPIFVRGVPARDFPDVAARVAAAGHEIGCHSDRHLPLTRFSPDGLARELRAGKAAVEAATGRVPKGFRAPYFSIGRKNLWALTAIADAGFEYDSSIFPIVHRRYGIPGWPREPRRVAGGRLVELPLATLECGRLRLPVAGGGYWRALPQVAVLRALDALASAGRPGVLYLHPYQLDPVAPEAVPGPLPWRGRLHAGAFRLAQSVGRGAGVALLDAVLERFQFETAGELAARCQVTPA